MKFHRQIAPPVLNRRFRRFRTAAFHRHQGGVRERHDHGCRYGRFGPPTPCTACHPIAMAQSADVDFTAGDDIKDAHLAAMTVTDIGERRYVPCPNRRPASPSGQREWTPCRMHAACIGSVAVRFAISNMDVAVRRMGRSPTCTAPAASPASSASSTAPAMLPTRRALHRLPSRWKPSWRIWDIMRPTCTEGSPADGSRLLHEVAAPGRRYIISPNRGRVLAVRLTSIATVPTAPSTTSTIRRCNGTRRWMLAVLRGITIPSP